MGDICHIIGAGDFYREHLFCSKGDFVIAADAGYSYLINVGITPNVTIGDFDSLGLVPDTEKIVLPVNKNDTDTGYAARWAYNKGFRRFELHGCTGGRFDHTIANIQTAAMLSRLGCDVRIHDKLYTYYALTDSEISFDSKASGTVSVFAHGSKATVSIEGLEYELNSAVIDPFYPLGVSNAFTSQKSRILVHSGTVLVIAPSDTIGTIKI